MKPKVSIGWFLEEDEDVERVRGFTEAYGHYVHLGFYEVDHLAYADYTMQFAEKINSIHLPKNLTLPDYKDGGIVPELAKQFDVQLFNVHPWADDLQQICEEVIENQTYTLCLETFGSKKYSKGSPFWLLAHFGRYMLESDRIGLTVDLSHLDNELSNYTFVKGLLPYTKMIHVSARKGKAQHLPIFTIEADVNARNIVGQVLNIKEQPVQEFVLEYQREYERQVVKHAFHVRDVVNAKRRKFKE